MIEIIQQHKKTLATLKSTKSLLTNNWEMCYKLAAPNRQMFNPKENKDDEYRELYDSTLIEATKLLTASLQSGTVPASAKWFKLDIENSLTSKDTPIS